MESEVDGSRQILTFFDSYCTFWRIVPVLLASGLDPEQTHHVVLRGLEGGLEKASYFQTETKREFYTKYRDEFDRPDDLLMGGLFIEEGRIVRLPRGVMGP